MAIRITILNGCELPHLHYKLDSKRMKVSSPEANRIAYELDGLGDELSGNIGLFAENDAVFLQQEKTFTLQSKTTEAVFYLAFGDKAIADASSKTFDQHNISIHVIKFRMLVVPKFRIFP